MTPTSLPTENQHFTFSLKDKILYALVTGFIATLFLPGMPVVNNIFIGLLVLFSFFYNSWKEKVVLLRQRKAVIFMLLFFLLHIASYFFSDNQHQAGRVLQMRSPLILFAIGLGLVQITERLKDRIILTYAMLVTLAAAICVTSALIAYSTAGSAALLYNDSLTSAIRMQSIYFAMMVNLAVFGFTYLLTRKRSAVKYPGVAVISSIFLLIVHFMLASRIAIVILYSGLLIFAFYYIIKRRKLLEGITLVMGLLIGCFLMVKFFPKTLNRFKELSYTDYKFDSKASESHYNMEVTSDQWNGANIRLAVWQCGWELSKERLFTGWQIGDKEDKLLEKYQEKQFEFAYRTKRNMHSTYLDVLSTFGIGGLVVFLLAYLGIPFASAIKHRDIAAAVVVMVFAIAMISESYLDRSLGNILLAFFSSFTMASLAPRGH